MRTKTVRQATKHEQAAKDKAKLFAVWIDQQQTHIRCLEGGKLWRQCLESDLPKQHRSTGGTHSKRPYARHSLSSEKNEHHWRQEHIKTYLRRLFNLLAEATRVVLLGPGPTKDQYLNIMQGMKNLASKVDPEAITVGKMTDTELDDFIREYFQQSKQ